MYLWWRASAVDPICLLAEPVNQRIIQILKHTGSCEMGMMVLLQRQEVLRCHVHVGMLWWSGL